MMSPIAMPVEENVRLETRSGPLDGILVLPPSKRGVVVFAHGSGSSRHSPRNQFVANQLQQRGHGTLLMDLLTSREEEVDAITAELRFDVQLLAQRLSAATDWLANNHATRDCQVGYFGASTGAAAALVAAAHRLGVAAIVSRGGRPDLAGGALRLVTAPTLLIVGDRDYGVIQLNRAARRQLERCPRKELHLVPGARIYSRNQARWMRSLGWRDNGLINTCPGLRLATPSPIEQRRSHDAPQPNRL